MIIEQYNKYKHNINGKILLDIEMECLYKSNIFKKNYLDQKVFLEPIYDCMLDNASEDVLSGNCQIWLSYDYNKKLIGFIISFFALSGKSQFIPSYVNDKQYYIASLYILPNYQNRGIGTKLLNLVINKCTLQNIYLTVDKINIKAFKFYKKNNFKLENKELENKELENNKLYLMFRNKIE